MEVCFVKNISGHAVPKEKDGEPPRFNANDGYYFKRGETKALTRAEAEFLCRNYTFFSIVGTHGEGGGSIPDNVLGTAKALEHFGIGEDDAQLPSEQPSQPPVTPPAVPPKK